MPLIFFKNSKGNVDIYLMDQAKEKLKTLLIQRPISEGADAAWARLAKSLSSFTDLEIVQSETAFQGSAGDLSLQSFQFIFLDYSLADWNFLESFKDVPVHLVTADPISLEHDGSRELIGNKIKGRSVLNISGLGASDLARLLHLFLIPKRSPGVIPLLEKGSVILGDKIQGPDCIGVALDRMANYLLGMESFELKERVPDLRQVLSAVLFECYRLAQGTETPYPTVDFQVGVSAKKLVLNLRFQNTQLSLADLATRTLNGTDLFWQQAWLCSDASLFTEHLRHGELEAIFLLHKPKRDPFNTIRTLLLKTLDRSGKRENLLAKPQDYTFQLLSDVRLKQLDVNLVTSSQDDVSSDIDLGSLPAPVVAKLKTMHEALAFESEQVIKKDASLRELTTRVANAEAEAQQRRAESIRLAKAGQVQADAAAKRIRDLERRIQNLQSQQTAEREAAKTSKVDAGATNEILPKLEANIRVLEGEKVQLLEKFTSEQKRYGMLEQKYQSLYKEIANKDKEINDLKATLIKMKKDAEKGDSAAAAAKAASANTGADTPKLKEMELREQALKQELKKMMFKVENHDKNVKAIQNENAEKTKLLEQKLGAAKAKELDLLKKIDELAAALKKLNKAA